ncbi:MAG: aminoacyl-tRNA hydrolase [Candidatus Niyogibacteria bacterium]|nr:aminoacyl-tRNA hydrolase [Candidatus Niyogibacteria bacterium]
MRYIVGLGNPGNEYEKTRHNAGRILAGLFAEHLKLDDFEYDKKLNAQKTEGKIGREKLMIILPDTFMNKSGNSLKSLINSQAKAKNLIIIHDDLDLPFGKIKISFGRNSGGHRGVESIMRTIKTKDFLRFRIGVSPAAPSGKLKKPEGKQKIEKLILGDFTPEENKKIKALAEKINQALATAIKKDYQTASSQL